VKNHKRLWFTAANVLLIKALTDGCFCVAAAVLMENDFPSHSLHVSSHHPPFPPIQIFERLFIISLNPWDCFAQTFGRK